MTQQLINLGAAPNDGTGDNLRIGGQKINQNFAELYSSTSSAAVAIAQLSSQKLDKTGGTLSGSLNLAGYRIEALGDPDTDDDAVSAGWVKLQIADLKTIANSLSPVTLAERDALPTSARRNGMLVYVQETDTTYRLAKNNTNPADAGTWSIALTREDYFVGGYRSVAAIADRDAIPTARRKLGMRVKVIGDDGTNTGVTGRMFELGGDLTNTGWTGLPTTAELLNRANHTGTQSADTLTDGANKVAMTVAQKRYLDTTMPTYRHIFGGSGTYYGLDGNYNIGWSISFGLGGLRHPDVDLLKSQATTAAAAMSNIATRRIKFGNGHYVAVDGNYNIMWRITALRFDHPVIDALGTRVTALEGRPATARFARDPKWDSISAIGEMLHMLIYGQSNAGGFGTTPVSPGSTVAFAQMFSAGVFPSNGTGAGSAVAALGEIGQETAATGAAKMIAQLLLAEDGIDITNTALRPFFSDSWSSSKKATDLAPGSTYSNNLKTQITNAKGLAPGSYVSGAMLYSQGEADYTANTAASAWLTTVRGIRTDFETAIQGTSGLAARPLPMIIPQVSTHLNPLVNARTNPVIALAQLGLASEDYYAIFPTHFMPYQAVDGLHFTAISQQWIGAYWGLYLKRWLFDGVKPVPLGIRSITRLGARMIVQWDVAAGRHLILDAAPGITNYGVTLDDGSGNAIAVISVTLSGRDTIEILAGATIPSGAKFRVGWIGNGFKGQAGIRDNAGETLVYDPTGLALPMHNWAPISETGAN